MTHGDRKEYGITRTDTFSSPFTTDYYKNITKEMLNEVLKDIGFILIK